MGKSVVGPLATLVVTLLLVSALGPLMVVSAAPTLPPDVVRKGTLTETDDRDDYNFTAQTGEWTVVASNNYQGTGTYGHGLRTNTTPQPIVSTGQGSTLNTRPAGVIAINGHSLSSPTDYTVSEERYSETPSYAVQLRQGMPTLSRNSQTVTGSLGADGIVVGYEIVLYKRDTLDLRLRIPPEWTYNYHFTLLLFGPQGRYHQFDGDGGAGPVKMSDWGENTEQALTYLAMDPGTYLIVLLNNAAPDNIAISLEVGLNGLPLASGATDDEYLNLVNEVDYYSLIAPTSSWSAAVVKTRADFEGKLEHSLHWPTADSNTIAVDEVTAEDTVGIIAINGRELSAVDSYYLREQFYGELGTTVPFTVQYDIPSKTLPPTNATTSANLSSDDIFRLYEIQLSKSHTADFRLQVGEDYNYDYDLGLYVFPPGNPYHSISGELPAYAEAPVAMSRGGENTEQDVVFTCERTGVYAVVVVNFAPRDDIPFTLEVTIQGRTLVDDVPMTGDLNAQNEQDLYQFIAEQNTWNLVGCRLTEEGGYLAHRLHSTALDTNHIREELVGRSEPRGDNPRLVDDPLGLIAIDGHELGSPTRYFVREEVGEGSPAYALELENAPTRLAADSDVISSSFGSDEFLRTYYIHLEAHDTLDVSVAAPENYTYPYELSLHVLPPGKLYRAPSTDGDQIATAAPGEGRDPALFYTAETTGEHLVVVANIGDMEELEYDLTYARNGFVLDSFGLTHGKLDPDNGVDTYHFDASSGVYNMVVVRLPESEPASGVTATLHWPTADSLPLATLELDPGDRVGALVVDGDTLGMGGLEHYVKLSAEVPEGRTVAYQVQVGQAMAGPPGGLGNISRSGIGSMYSLYMSEDQTVDLTLDVAPDYTYAFDMGLYLFAPDSTYMSTHDPEARPRSECRNGPATIQEVVFTSPRDETYAILILNHEELTDLEFNLTATIDGMNLSRPARGYVDAENRNEHYSFTANADQWNVLAASYQGGGGEFDLKMLSRSLGTNPIKAVRVSESEGTGVIAISGWEFDTPTEAAFANVSYAEGRGDFVVHAATSAVDFGPVGHTETAELGENEIAYIYHIELTQAQHLDISLNYDAANWSSDVLLDLYIYEPGQVLGSEPAEVVSLVDIGGSGVEGARAQFAATKSGTYGLIIVNKGPIGELGFSLGVYLRSTENKPPMYPVILRAEGGTKELKVQWEPNAESDFKQYELYLSAVAGEQGRKIDTITEQTADEYTITRLDPNHEYFITLVVYDLEGLSTSSNPFPAKTEKLPILMEPMLWVIIFVIIAVIVAIVGIDWLIKRQRAKGVSEAEASGAAAMPGVEAAPEAAPVEAEEGRPARREVLEDEAAKDRREAIDFMKEMMGDAEE